MPLIVKNKDSKLINTSNVNKIEINQQIGSGITAIKKDGTALIKRSLVVAINGQEIELDDAKRKLAYEFLLNLQE